MSDTLRIIASIIFAYLIGSIPTGVWLTRKAAGRDIREMGDGNTGARNVSHVLGSKEGFIVGLVDFTKGVFAILFTQRAGLGIEWQIISGVSSVIGHDFPIFAEFKGGQGMATMIGTMSVFFTKETATGLVLFGLIYLVTRNFDLSAAVGLGAMVYILYRSSRPDFFLVYAVGLLITIPMKKYWDSMHRVRQNDAVDKYTST